MKIVVKPLAARNPFVRAALFRKAGSHRKTNKQMRAAAKRDKGL